MIQKITLNKVASYREAVEINNLNRFNLFYGLNGTGKTTLSQYLADPSNLDYKHCSIEDDGYNRQLLVYNEKFVKKCFWESKEQAGVFTLGNINVEVENDIKKIDKEIEDTYKELDQNKKHKKKFTNYINSSKEKLREKVWETKKNYEKTGLDFCLDGLKGNKKKLLDIVLDSDIADVDSKDLDGTLEELNSFSKTLFESGAVLKQKISTLPEESINEIETNTIWGSTSVDTKSAYLKDLIDVLDHAEWVRQGIEKYLDKTEQCPFCNRSMDYGLKNKVKELLGEEDKKRKMEISELKTKYKAKKEEIERLIEDYEANKQLQSNTNLGTNLKTLKVQLRLNYEQISKKSDNIALKIQIESTNKLIGTVNNILQEENKKIEDFNEKLKKPKSAKQDVKKKFWRLIRKQYNTPIESFLNEKKNYENKLNTLNKKYATWSKKKENLKGKKTELQKQTKNIDESVRRIDKRLKSFGVKGFQFKKIDGTHKYRIEREFEKDDVFETLSEGEKTIITFLYFVELCLGSDNSEEAIHHKDKIIVIDDPISSLSSTLVFEIACIIKSIFLDKDKSKFAQVFVLSHHLYFFREVLGKLTKGREKRLKDESRLFRILKNDHTTIEELDPSQIKNDYEGYWHTLKDIRNEKISGAILPNTMRNILEYFFSFLCKEDSLNEILSKIADRTDDLSFIAFHRYLGRESHSDRENIMDTNEINTEKFFQYFKEVFEEAGFIDHYDIMLPEQNTLTVEKLSKSKVLTSL